MYLLLVSILWGTLFLLGAVLEIQTLLNPVRGDTLSEHVWRLRVTQVGRMTLMPLWVWLTWHFWIEPKSWYTGGFKDDITIVLAAVALGAVINYATR